MRMDGLRRGMRGVVTCSRPVTLMQPVYDNVEFAVAVMLQPGLKGLALLGGGRMIMMMIMMMQRIGTLDGWQRSMPGAMMMVMMMMVAAWCNDGGDDDDDGRCLVQ